MKKLIFILFVLLSFCNNLYAKCNGEGVYVARDSFAIKNSVFLVKSYINHEVLQNLEKNYQVYLKSKNDKVNLSVIKFNKSNRRLAQVLLKPQRKLIANEEYQLFIDSNNKHIYLYNGDQIFKVQNIVDHEKPKIKKNAEYLYKYTQELGCGPEAYAVFGVCLEDENPTFAITKLKDLETGVFSEFIIPIINHTISIGYGMCGGAFDLVENKEYEVGFTFMDLAGNKTIDNNKYYFTAPNDSDDIYKLEKKLFKKDNASKDEISLFIGYHYITHYYVEQFCKCGKYNFEPDFIFVSKSDNINVTSRYDYIHQNITLMVISVLIVIMILLFKYI